MRRIRISDKDTGEFIGEWQSQVDCAEELGVHFSTVSRWVRDPNRCKKYTVEVIKNYKRKEN